MFSSEGTAHSKPAGLFQDMQEVSETGEQRTVTLRGGKANELGGTGLYRNMGSRGRN